MKVVSAYLLSVLGGNSSPQASDIKSILDSVGAEVKEDDINKLLSSLEGKSTEDVVADGMSKLASVPSGGGGAVPAAAAAGGGGGGGGGDQGGEEEKEEEEEEEEMEFDLFD